LPETVEIDGKKMKPKEFADNVLGLNANDYVAITSFTHMPFYERVELLVPDNWSHGDDFLNVPLDEFMATLDYAIENGFTVAIGGDTSDKLFNQRKWGYGIVEQDQKGKVVTQKEREVLFDNWSSTDDHAMHVVGHATDEEGKRFYYTKNSWGKENGPYEGYCYFSVNFIRAKMNTILLHKDGVPAEIKAKLKLD
jgi:bleomycin hydrolase